MKKNIKWIIFAILLVLFGIITYAVVTGKIEGFDRNIYNIVTKYTNPTLDTIYKIITFFGSVIGIVVFVLAVLIFMKDKKKALWIAGGAAGATVVNNLIKFAVRRGRPAEPLFRILVIEKSYSFPSGHTMGSVGFYGMLIFFIWRSNLEKSKKIIFTTLLTLLILAVMVSRIYLGAHFASDVVAGAIVASAFLIVFTHFIKRKN